MRIPKRLHLMGGTYTVHIVPKAKWRDADAVGYFDPEKRAIYICKSSRESMVQTYLHELTHAILAALNRDDLYSDERFVDTYAGLLHQGLTSAEY